MKAKKRYSKSSSVLQEDLGECIICGTRYNIHRHEVFFGTANRQKSIKWGMVVGLCAYHHDTSNNSVHYNDEMDLKLKRYAQRKFQEAYPDEDFMEVFNRNYL